jgi:hypothetical protein
MCCRHVQRSRIVLRTGDIESKHDHAVFASFIACAVLSHERKKRSSAESRGDLTHLTNPGIPHAVAHALAYQRYQTESMRDEFVWQGTAVLVV